MHRAQVHGSHILLVGVEDHVPGHAVVLFNVGERIVNPGAIQPRLANGVEQRIHGVVGQRSKLLGRLMEVGLEKWRLNQLASADRSVLGRRERQDVRDDDIARLALVKFQLVKQGIANRSERIERNLREMGAEYDDVVPALFPEARRYSEAMAIVWPRIKPLIP